MTEVIRTRRIEAGPDEVWAALADFGSISRWAPDVDHSCLLSDQLDGAGTVRRIQSGRTTVVERVVDWEAPTSLAYRIDGLPPIVRSVVNRWTIEGANGAAEVSVTTEIDAGQRPPQRLAARAIGRRLGRVSEKMLAGLDRHLTGRELTP